MKDLKINELYAKAKELFEKNRLKDSLSILNDVIESGTDDKDCLSEAYFIMGNIFHMKGEIGKAIKAFNKVLELKSTHTDAAISLSVLYNDIGRYEEAQKIFKVADERVKRSSAKKDEVGDEHVNQKFSGKHFELGEMYFTYGRYDEALFEYNKASSLDPSNLEIRIKLAKVYAKKNFASKAFDELRALKNEHPAYLPARIALGILYYGNGKVVEAQNEWEKVLSKDPANQEAGMYLKLSQTATETSVHM